MKYDLLEKYIRIIKALESARSADCIELYEALEKDRAEMHNRLLEAFRANRADTKFALWLSEFCEEQLNT